MDDIKGSTKQPVSNADEPEAPMHQQEAPEPEAPMTAPKLPKETKKGMKTWLVVLLVILALVLGAGKVYYWQQANNFSNDNEQLQSQIDTLNQDLSEAKQVVTDSALEEKDKEIETLTTENNTLKAEKAILTQSNETLQQRNVELVTNCEAAGLSSECEPIIP